MLGISNLWSQNGLKADYYDGRHFERYVATQYVEKIDFYWNRTPPVEGINPHLCSVRYIGQLKSPKTGIYTFSARVDDGIRVWVDGKQIIDNWQLNDVGYSKGEIELIADSVYTLKVEYFNALLEAELRLLWEIPAEEKEEPEEEKSWWDSWWGSSKEQKLVVIPAEYFAPPIAEKETTIPVPEPPIVVKSEPKPQPKPKRTVKPQPVAKPPKELVVNTFQKYIPKSVEFNQAKSKILPVSYAELDKLADFLVKHPNHKVRIEGHTDNIGDEDKNFELSERRAYAVAAYLVKKGVPSKQLDAKGFGGSRPLVVSKDKKYNPENRRVAFIIQ